MSLQQEVRVRFSGFDNRHDEWVNVNTSVRERSIPVVPSECGRVKVGDLLLCFQVNLTFDLIEWKQKEI